MTQSEFVGKFNISVVTLRKWEQNKIRVQKRTFEKLKEMGI